MKMIKDMSDEELFEETNNAALHLGELMRERERRKPKRQRNGVCTEEGCNSWADNEGCVNADCKNMRSKEAIIY